MRINIRHPQVWLLATWTLSAGSLLFSVSPSVADAAQRAVEIDAHRSVESAVSMPLSPAHGVGDHDPIRDDDPVLNSRDISGKNGSTSSGFEDAQHVVPVVFVQASCTAPIIRAAHFESTSKVEPRFLRYARLLY
jgi:hypothetical protein